MAATPHVAQTLLNRAHSPKTAATIFTEKALHKPLHLRPTSPDPASQDARAQRRLQRLRKAEKVKRRQKVRSISAKEKRITRIYDIPDEAKKYEIYVPLHRLWLGYMWEILGITKEQSTFVTAQSKGSIMASADYHGAEMTVVRSRCASMVGLEGIVVRDTKFTFQIITKENQLKVIPKKHTIFRFDVPQTMPNDSTEKDDSTTSEQEKSTQTPKLIFELHGSQFENRAPDRATKKFKQKHLLDL